MWSNSFVAIHRTHFHIHCSMILFFYYYFHSHICLWCHSTLLCLLHTRTVMVSPGFCCLPETAIGNCKKNIYTAHVIIAGVAGVLWTVNKSYRGTLCAVAISLLLSLVSSVDWRAIEKNTIEKIQYLCATPKPPHTSHICFFLFFYTKKIINTSFVKLNYN